MATTKGEQGVLRRRLKIALAIAGVTLAPALVMVWSPQVIVTKSPTTVGSVPVVGNCTRTTVPVLPHKANRQKVGNH